MTTDDILRMAREAGKYADDEYARRWETGEGGSWSQIRDERFAALVAASERDECAKVCESISTDKWALYKGHKPYTGQEPGRAADFTQGQSDGAELCEQAIRARGTK